MRRALTQALNAAKAATAADQQNKPAEAAELYRDAAAQLEACCSSMQRGARQRITLRNKAEEYKARAEELSGGLPSSHPAVQTPVKARASVQPSTSSASPAVVVASAHAVSTTGVRRVAPSAMYSMPTGARADITSTTAGTKRSVPSAQASAAAVSAADASGGSGRAPSPIYENTMNEPAAQLRSESENYDIGAADQSRLDEPLLSQTVASEIDLSDEDENSHSFKRRRQRSFSAKCFFASILVAVALAAAGAWGVLTFLKSRHGSAPSPQPTPGASPSPGAGPHPTPAPAPQSPSPGPPVPENRYRLWNGLTDSAAWFDIVDVNIPANFDGPVPLPDGDTLNVQVDIGSTSRMSTQLYGNPKFQQFYDDIIRAWNPEAHLRTGTIDACGFPVGEQARTDTPELEFFKRTDCLYDDFRGGFNTSRFVVAEVKGCCGQPGNSMCFQFINQSRYPADIPCYKFAGNIGVEEMEVQYPHDAPPVKKNVLRLTALNKDNEICAQDQHSPLCHKDVVSNGVIQTRDIYASARYEVVAKVPATKGLVWAMWTFHYEEHIPGKSGCDSHTCYLDGFRGGELERFDIAANATPAVFKPEKAWNDCCDYHSCCMDGSAGAEESPVVTALRGSPPDGSCPVPPADQKTNSTCKCCDYALDQNTWGPGHQQKSPCCVASKAYLGGCPSGENLCDKDYSTNPRVQQPACHERNDPQWQGNASMLSWLNNYNHEIDIEIPANCMGTTVCAQTPQQCQLGNGSDIWCNTTERNKYSCADRLNTANLNNYLMTTNGGTGHAYSAMCVATYKKTKTEAGTKKEPFKLVGDGKFHKYTIDWHTGGDGVEARVDFFVDDVLISTNNLMVPTRGSRLVIGRWSPNAAAATSQTSKVNPDWANFPDFWGGGKPGDGLQYLDHTYISEVKITPHNEANDIMYPATYDRPDGCDPIYGEKGVCHKRWESAEDLGWPNGVIEPAIPAGRAAPGSMAGDATCPFRN